MAKWWEVRTRPGLDQVRPVGQGEGLEAGVGGGEAGNCKALSRNDGF